MIRAILWLPLAAHAPQRSNMHAIRYNCGYSEVYRVFMQATLEVGSKMKDFPNYYKVPVPRECYRPVMSQPYMPNLRL